MFVEINSENELTTVRVHGPLDAAHIVAHRRRLEAAANEGRHLVVDLEQSTFLDPAGICFLTHCFHQLKARQLSLSIENVNGQPRSLLEHLKLMKPFNVQTTEVAANDGNDFMLPELEAA